MKCISVWQPWASLIAVGAKRIETRSWDTAYRGPLAIHAAKHWTKAEKLLCGQEPFKSALARAHPRLIGLPYGKIVAVCRLSECEQIARADVTEQERAFGNFLAGRFAWFLTDVRCLELPVPWTGSRGFFSVPDEYLEEKR